MLFKVVLIDTNEIVDVYDVTYDSNGYPQFLIYRNNQWIRKSAKNYKPYINIKERYKIDG